MYFVTFTENTGIFYSKKERKVTDIFYILNSFLMASKPSVFSVNLIFNVYRCSQNVLKFYFTEDEIAFSFKNNV